MKVRFLKAMDRFIGSILVKTVPKPRIMPVREPRRILFIRPGGIGDAVLLIPAIRALKDKYPGCEVTVLAEKRNGAVFSFCSHVRRTYRYDKLRELFSTLCGSYDVVVDTEQWHFLSALTARLTGSSMIIGFATNERSRMFTHSVPYSHETYEVLSFFSLLKPLGFNGDFSYLPPFLDVPGKAIASAAAKLGDFSGRRYITIFPGASIPERRWGVERFRELASRLHGRGFAIIVVGGDGDEETGREIVVGGVGLNLAGRTSLAETAAVISGSMLLITGDSGVLHLAVGLGIRTLSLFGPGIEKKWAPSGESHFVLNKRLSCSPCTRFGYTPACRIGCRCLAEIGVDEVEDAALRVLERYQEGKNPADQQKS